MKHWLSLVSILLSILLMGCSPRTNAQDSLNTPATATIPKGQNLPISAQAILPQGTKIQLEVARTQAEQMMGLMYRPALPDDRGMLFEFSSPQPVQFWMKNVPVALDMVFLNQGVVRYIQSAAPPCESEPCPTYGPNVPINQVIELRAGRAKELGLKIGDVIKVESVQPDN
jgi:uncharacterized membrane protein (UPF0127 family)